MPKQVTGELRWSNGVAIARVTLRGRERASLPLPHCRTEADGRERARLLAELARRMRVARVELGKARKALEFIAEAKERALPSHLSAVEDLIGGKLAIPGAPAVPTFGEVAGQWVKGELARKYPGHIKAKRSADDDESRLRLYILPKLGPLPVNQITLDDCEQVMAALPEKMAVATRRNVGQLITRIFSMCVYPLRLIERSPLPPKFLPRAPEQAQHVFLYPSEDARLMAHTACPLVYRMLWGVLAREGMRLSEALELRWSQLDLDRGALRLGRTKTDSGRTWALDRGVVAALQAYRKLRAPNDGPLDRVFVDAHGRAIVGSGALGLPMLLRQRLAELGIDRERPELFESAQDGSTRRLRCHDLRASFITINLANGRTETWIADRTGHKSSIMINRYRRAARTAAELNLGTFAPLDEAIPEFAITPGLPREPQIDREKLASPAGFEPASPP